MISSPATFSTSAAGAHPETPPSDACSHTATPAATGAPKKAAKNTGFWIATSIFCITSMNVRSAVLPSASMTEHA